MTTILNRDESLVDYIRGQVMDLKVTYTILITASGKHTRQMRKSTTALSLATKLDPEFDMTTQIAVADTEDVLELLGSIRGRGRCVILDEMGVAAGHRSFLSSFNRAIGDDFQMHGNRGLIVIVTAPQERLVDLDVRSMFNMVITITYKNEKLHYVKAKVEEKYNVPIKGASVSYGVFFRRKCLDGSVKMIKRVKIFFPSKKRVLEPYFELANRKKTEKLESTRAKLKAMRMKAETEQFSPDMFVAEMLKSPEKFVRYTKAGTKKFLPIELIMNAFPGIGRTRAKQIEIVARDKLVTNPYGDEPRRDGSTNPQQNSGDSKVNF
jgi:hypothetical protein